MPKMTDTQLRQALDYELQQSVLWTSDGVREEQQRNLQYYLGLPRGDEVEGRSQVVSWDVFEVVESAMPNFIEPFFAGDYIGEFSPRKPQDEPFAAQATDYVNMLFKEENDGFLIMNAWIKDALISKVGVVRADWIDQDPKRQEFTGLSTEQLTMLTQDPASEIIEHAARPMPIPGVEALNEAQMMQMYPMGLPMLHDVTVMQKQPGRVEVENVRPELFVITRGCARPDKARLIGEIATYTRGELHEQGFKDAFTIKDFDEGSMFNSDEVQTIRDGAWTIKQHEDTADEAQQEVKLFRGFIRADVNGDKVAEWRRVLVGSGEKPFLENEECEYQHYCVISPIPLPHRVIGLAYADAAAQIQDINTSLTRQYLDGLYLANRPRTYVNVSAGVNMDDLLNDRIGGIVRGTQPANIAIQPLITNVTPRDALEGLEMGQTMRERRLGITRYNQGLEADSLNKTASGQKMIQTAGDKRQLMTLRIMAETGIKELFKLILRLVCQYQDQAKVARLRGEWVEFDPRQWSPDMDVMTSVGVGTGDKIETLSMLREFGQYMAAAETKGLVSREEWYEFGLEMAKTMGLKGAGTRYIKDPKTVQEQPQQPPYQVTVKQMELQADAQKFQAETQAELQRIEMEAEAKRLELQSSLSLQAQNDERDAAREIQRAQLDAELEAAKQRTAFEVAEMQARLDKYKADLDAQTKLAIAEMGVPPEVDLGPLEKQLAELMDYANSPAEIVRGADGRAEGVKRGKKTMKVQRDANGRATGVQ